MIIQLQTRNPYTFAHNPLQNTNIRRQLTDVHKSKSPSITMRKGNIIRISIQSSSSTRKHSPNIKSKHHNHNSKYYTNKNLNSGENMNWEEDWRDIVNNNSSSFKPILQPRRTYGSLKYFLEVLQKKVRARSIEDTFEHCNYQLDVGQFNKRGFRGSKLSAYSQFYGAAQLKQQSQVRKNKNINWKEKSKSKMLDEAKQQNQIDPVLKLHSQNLKTQQLRKQQKATVQTQPTSQSVLSNFQSYLNQYQEGYNINSDPRRRQNKIQAKTSIKSKARITDSQTTPSSPQAVTLMIKQQKKILTQTQQLGQCRNKFRHLKQAVP